MQENNFRRPVEYIIKRHQQKTNIQLTVINDAEKDHIELPEYPCRLVRDINNKVNKVIYAEGTELEWTEELIRNTEGKVYQIKTTYPDESYKTIELFKNIDGKVETIDYV
ncbi:hypothetical protein [Clostridium sp. JNZ J1-5]